jgi:oligopeptide/dipeptide ABC transporter ATP-binding protein
VAGKAGPGGSGKNGSLLVVDDLQVEFHTSEGIVYALNGVSFEVAAGETVGLVGESASGKSVTALTVMGLLARPTGRVVGGNVYFRGQNLLKLPPDGMRRLRGAEIAMIFQNPMSALNPLMPIGFQIAEVLEEHRGVPRRQALGQAVELLKLVGIPSAEQRVHDRPYQMSGGMCQRVMIAAAVACEPVLLLADEPTTALDVTIQAQILELLARLRREMGMSMVLISHDLGVVAGVCDRVSVMYAGRIVEEGKVDDIFAHPRHPYTLGLLRSIPNPEQLTDQLSAIEGSPPDQRNPLPGCPFVPRCAYRMDRCSEMMPPVEFVEPGHYKRCWADLSGETR